VLSCALPPAQPQLLKVIGSVGEHREGGRPLPPSRYLSRKSEVSRHKEAEGAASLFQGLRRSGRGGKEGPRQGELPTSLAASLIGSLCLSVTMSQPEWFVPECIFSVHDLVSLTVDRGGAPRVRERRREVDLDHSR
jgi:hypothetical protein